MRGREQQLTDYYGGVGSPFVDNKWRGVSQYNLNGYRYWKSSNSNFGPLAPFTGLIGGP